MHHPHTQLIHNYFTPAMFADAQNTSLCLLSHTAEYIYTHTLNIVFSYIIQMRYTYL